MARGPMIRDFRPEDAASAAALAPEYQVVTAQGLLHTMASYPPRAHARAWVKEVEGRVTGFAMARFKWATKEADVGRVRTHPPSHDLLQEAERHLLAHGARTLVAYGGKEAWLLFEERGYRPTRTTFVSALEPRPVELPQRDDAHVASLPELAGREHDVYELYMTTDADMPGDHSEDNVSFDEWLRETFEHPDLDRSGSFVVLVEDRPVALAFLEVDHGRKLASNEMTGTLADFRGRGLATLAKLATVRWAAEHRIRRIYTSNDEENAAMLAVNRRLGYQPVAMLRDYER
jgi:RimJ/RimL family protein N-acetyltransferase